MADPDHFIDGIYNYCDRWCARCPLSGRCRLYALEQQLGDVAPGVDAAAFWAALGMVTPPDSELGDDELEFSPGSDDADLLSEVMEREEQVDRDPCVGSANAYGMDASLWLREHGDEAMAGERRSEIPVTPSDAVAVIGWYATMIGGKLARAVSARLELEEDQSWDTGSDWRGEAEETAGAIREARENEAAGSAKVALLGIERSLGAWTVLRDILPGRDGEIVTFQKRLARSRRQVDTLFPEARTFIRPGFDDGTRDDS